MPQPRLTNQLARIGESDNSQGSRVTLEAVEAVQGHLVTILGGLRVPCADIQALVGDMVHVEWNAGRPVRVIDFEVRRGSVFFTTHVVGKSVIEELFIADFTDPVTKVKKKDVYFRNLQQITRLKVNDFTGGAEPGLVIWGMNDDVFAVRDAASATRFHVFRLNRPANQTGKSLHKVYGSRPAKIAAKLYTADLQDNSLTLTTITAKFRRDSIEPVFGLLTNFHLEGFGDSFFPFSGTGFGNDFGGALFGTNTNIAAVDRVVKVNLTGLTASVEGVTVPASECVVQTGGDPLAPVVTAALVDFMVDENDELLVSVQVKFDGFGIKQGNPTTGLTGDRKGVGPGAFKNFGFFNIFNQYPFIVDDFGVQDFNGHGNVGGVLSTDTTEAHSILMKARGGVIVFSTLKTAPVIEAKEDTSGITPYFASEYVHMFDLGLHDPPEPRHAYTYGGHDQTYIDSHPVGPVTNASDFGLLGYYGVIKKERSFFKTGLPFDPDGVPRTIQVFADEGDHVLYAAERHDGWDSANGQGGLWFPTKTLSKVTFKNPLSDVKPRYDVTVTATPFFSENGQPAQFISVLRTPRNDPPMGDPIQLGIFILTDTLTTIQAYATVTDSTLPVLMTGNAKHVLWRYKNIFYLSNGVGTTLLVGENADDEKAQGLRLTRLDLLYATLEKERYFVDFFNRTTGALTLQQSNPKFPPREKALDNLGALKNLVSTMTTGRKVVQTVADPVLVPKKFLP